MSFLVILKFQSTAKKEWTYFGSWSNYSINWLIFRHLIELIIKSFDQLKSVKNFGQLIMKVLINWKITILIKWILVKRPPVFLKSRLGTRKTLPFFLTRKNEMRGSNEHIELFQIDFFGIISRYGKAKYGHNKDWAQMVWNQCDGKKLEHLLQNIFEKIYIKIYSKGTK